jgi:capsular exopolysaccharide synthesis family protein
MKEMTVAVEVRASNVTVADRAVPPTAPAGNGPGRSIGFAALLAAIAGIVLAYVRDALDDTVRTTDDLERAVRLPTLGVVPAGETVAALLPRVLGRSGAAAGATVGSPHDPRPALTDAYRQIRTSLLLSRPGSAPRTLLVTSALDGEGKTLTAANLAVAFSHVAGSVLLIDADLRRPRAHRLLGVAGTPGLTELLTGQCAVDDVLTQVDGHPLTVLPAGATPPNPTELLGSGEMRLLVAEAASRFDYVVIDAPAALAVADPMVLSTLVDGVVVVARRGRTRRRLLHRLRARLLYVRASIAGVVLNGGDPITDSARAYFPAIELVPRARTNPRRVTEAA